MSKGPYCIQFQATFLLWIVTQRLHFREELLPAWNTWTCLLAPEKFNYYNYPHFDRRLGWFLRSDSCFTHFPLASVVSTAHPAENQFIQTRRDVKTERWAVSGNLFLTRTPPIHSVPIYLSGLSATLLAVVFFQNTVRGVQTASREISFRRMITACPMCP